MTVHFASDHAGFEMKNDLLAFVRESLGLEVKDHGAFTYDADDDYPDFVSAAIRDMSDGDRAIILGGSGQGEAIAANRFPGARAAVYYGGPKEIITLSREHNNANVLSLGARFLARDEAAEAVRLWLRTSFPADERHVRRNAKLDRVHKRGWLFR